MKFKFLLSVSFFIISFIVLIFLTSSARAVATHVVISEVQLSGATANDEFIELYNPTETTISLQHWKLTKKTAGGTESNIVATISGAIAAHGYFLIARSEYQGTVTPDVTYTNNLITSDNTVLLYDNTKSLIDKVGLGSMPTLDKETAPVSAPSASHSAERKANSTSTISSMTTGSDALSGNGEDTDNNAADFIIRTVSDPQNSHSTIEPIILTSTPSFTLTPTFTVTPSTSSEPSITPTFTITPTVSPSSTPTETITPTFSISPTPTNSPTLTPTFSITPTESNTPTPTLTPLLTPSSRITPTPSTILEPTATPTMTIVLSPTKVITPTPNTHHYHTVCSWYSKTIHIFGFRFPIPYFYCERALFHK